MKSYTLNFAGGGQCVEFFAPNDAEAVELAQCKLVAGGCCSDPVVADQWDQAGYNDADEPCKRLLVWDSEASAENDSGANAIAQIETVGQA